VLLVHKPELREKWKLGLEIKRMTRQMAIKIARSLKSNPPPTTLLPEARCVKVDPKKLSRQGLWWLHLFIWRPRFRIHPVLHQSQWFPAVALQWKWILALAVNILLSKLLNSRLWIPPDLKCFPFFFSLLFVVKYNFLLERNMERKTKNRLMLQTVRPNAERLTGRRKNLRVIRVIALSANASEELGGLNYEQALALLHNNLAMTIQKANVDILLQAQASTGCKVHLAGLRS
jgi:hypothetical protein